MKPTGSWQRKLGSQRISKERQKGSNDSLYCSSKLCVIVYVHELFLDVNMRSTFVTGWPPTSSAPTPCEGRPAGGSVSSGGWWVGIDIPHKGLEPSCCKRRRGGNRGNAPETQHRLTRMEWTRCSSTKTRLPETEKIRRIPSSPRPSVHPVKQSWAQLSVCTFCR